MTRSKYRKETRKNICVDNETYEQLILLKKALIVKNKTRPFTDKAISQHDTIKWLLKNCPLSVDIDWLKMQENIMEKQNKQSKSISKLKNVWEEKSTKKEKQNE